MVKMIHFMVWIVYYSCWSGKKFRPELLSEKNVWEVHLCEKQGALGTTPAPSIPPDMFASFCRVEYSSSSGTWS